MYVHDCVITGLVLVVPQFFESVQILVWVLLLLQLDQTPHAQFSVQMMDVTLMLLSLLPVPPGAAGGTGTVGTFPNAPYIEKWFVTAHT